MLLQPNVDNMGRIIGKVNDRKVYCKWINVYNLRNGEDSSQCSAVLNIVNVDSWIVSFIWKTCPAVFFVDTKHLRKENDGGIKIWMCFAGY